MKGKSPTTGYRTTKPHDGSGRDRRDERQAQLFHDHQRFHAQHCAVCFAALGFLVSEAVHLLLEAKRVIVTHTYRAA